jgi:hypothetical protein
VIVGTAVELETVVVVIMFDTEHPDVVEQVCYTRISSAVSRMIELQDQTHSDS